jgi:putative ABC transport system permease protein
MNIFTVFKLVSLRHATGEKGKFFLSVFGVAIGVAVWLAIKLANHSALKAFESATDNVNGKATMQVQSLSGTSFDQSVFKKILDAKNFLKDIQAATPVTEQLTQIRGTAGDIGEPLVVLGIDVFTDRQFRTYTLNDDAASPEDFLRFLLQPNTIFLFDRYAERNHITKGQTITLIASGVARSVTVIGILKSDTPTGEAAASFGVMDIEQAQRTFAKAGKLDKIDLLVPPEHFNAVQKYLQDNLPETVEAAAAKNRGQQIGKMLAAFELNLSALSFISLLVSMFLIYNTITTNALRRRREVGILRCLGLNQVEVFILFLAEALMIGIIGSALGVAAGIGLAQLALEKVSQTITTLYIFVEAKQIFIAPTLVVTAFFIGVLAAIASAVYPAYEVAKVHPRETFFVQAFEKKFSVNVKKIFITSIVLLVAAYGLTRLPAVGGFPVFGFMAALCVILAFAFVSPEVVILFRKLFEKIVGRFFGIEGVLANNNLVAALNRTSTAVSALMVAVAMLIGIAVMVGSFRSTVAYWIDQTLKADVFVAPSMGFAVGSQVPVSPDVVPYAASLPEVQSVDAFSSRRIRFQDNETVLAVANLDAVRESSKLIFRKGDEKEILSKIIADENSVAVTEAFSNKFGINEGDSLTLTTAFGQRRFRVAGVYYDYATDRGLVLVHRPTFEKYWLDTKVTNIGIFLKDKSQTDRIVQQIRDHFKTDASIVVYSNYALRQNVLKIFDQTFAITYALQFVAMLVAAMGVISSLTAIIFERKREIAVLRSMGASARQVQNITLIEAFLMGVIASVLGMMSGFLLSLILVFVINLQSFGWTIQLSLPIETFVTAAAIVIATALVSGLIPARYASRLAIAEEVRFE